MTAIDDPGAPAARNPRREAQEVAGDGFDARVLEPSPPAVTDGELADDPVAAGPEATARPVVAPVASTDPTRTQLWPEHFDAAFDCLHGSRRATSGASPGDAAVPEPYLYVLPCDFGAARPDGFWNAGSFRGGILGLGELVDAPDQRAAALRFLRRGRELLRD